MRLTIYAIMICAWLLLVSCAAEVIGTAIGDSLNTTANLFPH